MKTKSGRTGHAFLKVYKADRQTDSTLAYPDQLRSSINDSVYHIGPVSTNASGNVLYVTAAQCYGERRLVESMCTWGKV
ncbi:MULTISPECIES: hypothetical protein [Sphingobacterium]|uniref:hypothetical protein n=1 Tax=Sphingobacterium TaxID=28453 RepID=UPI0013DA738C|nr:MULTISPECIES: hypothetical protein [unclassified Sphingobacterium]